MNKEFYFKMMNYISNKGYAPDTLRQHSWNLKKICKQYKILNDNRLKMLLKNIKSRKERSVLALINDYCYFNRIDFIIVLPKIKTPTRKVPEIISIEEIRIMIDSVPKPYDLMIRCLFNIGSGLSGSEGIKLCWNNIKWAKWLNTGGTGIAIINNPINEKRRAVNIPKKLMNDLYQYAKELRILNEFGIPIGNMIFKCGKENFKPDLMSNNIKLWKYKYLIATRRWLRYNIIEKHCNKILNKKIRLDSFMRSKATYLYKIDKVPIENIQQLLGHASIETTSIYTKVDPMSSFELIKNTKEI